MLAKMEENEQRKEGGKKRKHPKGEERDRKRRGDCDGGGDGDARKRLDPLSVGYFRRVGERLTEGFAENEEKGEMSLEVWMMGTKLLVSLKP